MAGNNGMDSPRSDFEVKPSSCPINRANSLFPIIPFLRFTRPISWASVNPSTSDSVACVGVGSDIVIRFAVGCFSNRLTTSGMSFMLQYGTVKISGSALVGANKT